ncbi:Uncharacterised protein [Bordetella pertussis]|nr:Uncharacterised protein [Bordetella pertussis]
MSKRYDGGVTTKSSPCSWNGRPRRVKICATSARSTATPSTRWQRASRMRTGRLTHWSSTGPACPPQMSRMSRVISSMCSGIEA